MAASVATWARTLTATRLSPRRAKARRTLNCVEELLPPLRLAHLAEIAARNALRRNISESVAHLTGGEYFKFKNVKTLDHDLFTIANHIPNRYVLSFVPTVAYARLPLHRAQAARRVRSSRSKRADGYWVNPDDGSSRAATLSRAQLHSPENLWISRRSRLVGRRDGAGADANIALRSSAAFARACLLSSVSR